MTAVLVTAEGAHIREVGVRMHSRDRGKYLGQCYPANVAAPRNMLSGRAGSACV